MPFDEVPPEEGNWWDGGDDPHNEGRIADVVQATLLQLTLNCEANEVCPVCTFTHAMVAIAQNVDKNLNDALAHGAPPEAVARYRSQLSEVVARLDDVINGKEENNGK